MPKDGSLSDLLVALRTARRGVLVVHHSLLSDAVTTHATEQGAPRVALSRRERDVLAMLTVGLDVRSIADQLGISLNTCRGYVKTLLHKLDAHSQLEAVAIARRLGLTVTDDAR
jgi:DNA-binding NarL/FixJ family response regulator